MVRTRIALYAQAAISLICVRGFRNYTETWHHPIGFQERAYTWAALASLFITAWLFEESIIIICRSVENKLATIRKCIVILVLSLLILLITELAVDGMLTRY